MRALFPRREPVPVLSPLGIPSRTFVGFGCLAANQPGCRAAPSEAFLAVRNELLALEYADRRPLARLFGAMRVSEDLLTPGTIAMLRWSIARSRQVKAMATE